MKVAHLAAPLLAAASLLGAGCAKEATDFSTGVEPWEVPASAPSEWPAMPTTPGTVALSTGDRLASGGTPAHSWAHGRVLLAAPLSQVWAALQWRAGALLAVYPDTPTVDCEPTDRTEPEYELSFSVKEIPNGFGAIGRANWFLVEWRAAATRDVAGSIQKVNVKAQKVDGTTQIVLMRESIVATPAPGGGTELEIVRHINAPDESPVTAGEWIQLWVAGLAGQLSGTPLLPESYCFPQ
jgi:hypothetical protein